MCLKVPSPLTLGFWDSARHGENKDISVGEPRKETPWGQRVAPRYKPPWVQPNAVETEWGKSQRKERHSTGCPQTQLTTLHLKTSPSFSSFPVPGEGSTIYTQTTNSGNMFNFPLPHVLSFITPFIFTELVFSHPMPLMQSTTVSHSCAPSMRAGNHIQQNDWHTVITTITV